jgi:hypothetical protein
LPTLLRCGSPLPFSIPVTFNSKTAAGGVLVIKMKSAVVRNELSYQKSEILKKINQKTGKEIVKEIILK